jgi:ectoine utilization protein EutC
MTVTILTEAEIRRCAGIDEPALQAVADGFSRLSLGQASLPPILRIDIPEAPGEVDVKTAYIHGLERFAVKVASGFFENPRLGLPSGSGLMLVISARTGFLEAVLLDNGYLTDVRTALAGALAARYLAPQTVEIAGIIGAGAQARYQARALKLVRDFHQLLVWARRPQAASDYAAEMSVELGIAVAPAPDAESLVRRSQVVVTTTPARQPVLQAAWLHPGLHITAMGADTEHKQELDPAIFKQAGLIACDERSQCFRLGELHHALQAGILEQDAPVVELGELASGQKPGRRDEQAITVCDLTGVGVQDTAIALLALQRARQLGLGLTIEA